MNLVAGGLAVACAAGLAAAAAGVIAPARWRAALVGLLTAVAGAGGAVAGTGALTGQTYGLRLPHVLPLSEAVLAVDALGGVFLLIVGAVAAAAAVYGIGYAGHGEPARTPQVVLPLFVVVMLLVPVAGNVTTFLVLWELMALTSLILVLAEHRERAAVREAGLWYAVMTHAGLVVILLGLVVFAAGAGGESFAALRAGAGELSPAVRSLVFVLTFAGFGSKAGMVPLHVWLPRAHPEAPSHVSALMSAAMVKLGLYGIVRVGYDLLGGGPRWWGVLVLALGAASALYGILQATVATDLKRLLGYSTTENMGLMFIGVGAAGVFAAAGSRPLSGLLLAAALLHAVNHAAFKTLLFLGAGSVLRATGTRDLDSLGGLAGRMPVTTALFAVGAVSAAALPPGNGFVSEWLLLQGLIHSLSAASTLSAVVIPIAVGVIALTAGLGVATFVKAFGVGFLARPRSVAADRASESPATMVAGMAMAALACAGPAIAPAAAGEPVARAVAAVPGLRDGAPLTGDAVTLRLAGIAGSMSPTLIAVGLVLGMIGVAVCVRLAVRARSRRVAEVWGCGGTRLSPRMEYTATSFAEPLQRVFDDVLQPEQDLDVTHHEESRYLIESVEFRQRVPDRLEARLYPPLLAALRAWGIAARRLQNGSVHRYLGYGFVGLVLLLVVVAV
jgi:hydrogenase-4 component B